MSDFKHVTRLQARIHVHQTYSLSTGYLKNISLIHQLGDFVAFTVCKLIIFITKKPSQNLLK